MMPSQVDLDQKERICMLVIIDTHILWNLWCIDFLKKVDQESIKVVVLDLSSYRPKRHNRNSKQLLTKFYRKNRIDRILYHVIKYLKIDIINTGNYQKQKDHSSIQPHKVQHQSFLNGLDSEYFEEIGERVTSQLQIKNGVLNHAKQLYDDAFEITVNAIIEERVTEVVLPGGRTLVPNAVIAAAQSQKTPCKILEQTTSNGLRYLDFPADFRQNHIVHQNVIDRVWSQGGDTKYRTAKTYLDSKLYRGQLGRNFSLQFDVNLAIPLLEKSKLATIFVGSGFEMAPTDDDSQTSFLGSKNQKKMFELFAKIASEHEFTVVVRGHPATPGYEDMYAAEDLEWEEFCRSNNLLYIPSDSKIDTYGLIRQSDLNVVYASSVGIDSIILGGNTLVLGNVDWAHLVPEICAFNEQSIRERFQNIDRVVDVKKIYPYAFYMEVGGIEISNAEIGPSGTIFYEGQEINAPRFAQIQKILKR